MSNRSKVEYILSWLALLIAAAVVIVAIEGITR
jgi:acyl-CoA synthetase (AMP-forming)/AMP-acid ligase II